MQPTKEEEKKIVERQTQLFQQTFENFDPSLLTPLSPDVISRQATINIGTIGHVAHGKSTIVRAISGVNVHRSFPHFSLDS